MAKKAYNKKKKTDPIKKKKSTPTFHLSPVSQFLLAAGIIFIIILIYFAPIVFENKIPPSTDIIAWKGNSQSIVEAKKEFHYTPLWANNVFSGMPAQLVSLRPPFEQPARYIIEGLAKIFQWQAIYYLLGALGMLLLMRFWNVTIFASLFASFAFIWWPHFMGHLEAGHNSKLQTIMCIPLVLYLFLQLLKKANVLNFTLFTIAFSIAVRAGHYQIVFYLAIALGFFGFVHIAKMILDKKAAAAFLRLGLVLAGFALGVSMSAFHSLQVQEYSKYSIRGGTGEKGSKGLDFDYATQWSLHPGEVYNFIIPRFWGGHTSQIYAGDAVPQLKGKTIPGYWGHMPFTSTTDYLGVVAVLFAVFGIVLGWKNTHVKILVGLLIFSLVLAFGRHFPFLYKLFFNAMPFFNKFRVPTMIVVLVMFTNAALAGIGLNILLTKIKDFNQSKLLKIVIIVCSIFILLAVIPLMLRQSLPFATPSEIAQYGKETLAPYMQARFDLLKGDAIRMLAFVAIIFGLIIAYIKNWLSKWIFAGAAIIFLLLDLLPIDKRYMQQLYPKSDLDSYFIETRLDQFLKNDPEIFRIYPLGELSGQAHWSYYFQSIEGYHPAKLRIYQDIREFCLLNGTAPGFNNNPQIPINWNIVNMLNTKYVLARGNIVHQNLEPVYQDQSQNIIVYKNRMAFSRAFCVGQTELITDMQERFKRINQASFKPDSVALMEKELHQPVFSPSDWNTQITRYEPNYIDVNVSSDKQTLLVLSEIYYPVGWKAFINNQEAEIYKVNHILRAVVVPEGESKIEFRLEPSSLKISTAVMGGSISLVYILFVFGLLPVFRQFIKKS